MQGTTQDDLLIRGGRVIDPASGRDESADVLIRDGLVDSILQRYTRHVATHWDPARDTGRIQERAKTRPHLAAR